MDENKPEIPKIEEPKTAGLEQPMAITLFGVFNIAIGGLCLFTSPCTILGIAMSGETYGMGVGYTLFVLLTYLLGLILYFWQMSLGAGLIMLKKWARRGTVKYAWIAVLWWVFRRVIDVFALWAGWVSPAEGDTPVFIGRMCLSSMGFIYPVLLLIFMRTEKVKEAFAAVGG